MPRYAAIYKASCKQEEKILFPLNRDTGGGESWPQMRDMSSGEAGGVESWM